MVMKFMGLRMRVADSTFQLDSFIEYDWFGMAATSLLFKLLEWIIYLLQLLKAAFLKGEGWGSAVAYVDWYLGQLNENFGGWVSHSAESEA